MHVHKLHQLHAMQKKKPCSQAFPTKQYTSEHKLDVGKVLE